MNKTLVLITSATVLMMASVVVMALTTGSLGGLNERSSQTDERCGYEYDQADSIEDVSPKCKQQLNEMEDDRAKAVLRDRVQEKLCEGERCPEPDDE